MNISEKEFLAQWQNQEQIFKQHKEFSDRFDWLDQLFEDFMTVKIDINETTGVIRIDEEQLNGTPDLAYFGCAEDDLNTDEGREASLDGHLHKFNGNSDKIKNYIRNVYRMMGGFGQNSVSDMKPYFRITSCAPKDQSDKHELSCVGFNKRVSSHLATNTYFFWVIKTIKDMSEGIFKPNKSHIVHMSPYSINLDETHQKEILNKRFPYKFLHMWANREKLIHLVGLEQYQNVCANTDKNAGRLLFGDKDINSNYEDFKESWSKFSNNILDLLKNSPELAPDKDDTEIIKDASKLLSIMFSEDLSVWNLQEFLETQKSLVLWGPPGTGKTYIAKELARKVLELNEVEPLDKCEQFKLVQFHPNYTYEDFIGGIFPKCDSGDIAYELHEGSFKKFCDDASDDKDKKYVFIIDEINRADLSSVFGELLYALEYRGESVTIPNFDKPFSIPENVYIIGTMNNVDKSLTGFDFAMRRRFGFYKMMPDLDKIKDIITAKYSDADKMNISNEQMDLYTKRCRELNDKIKEDPQLGENYQIGQAYFGEIANFIGEDSEITTLHLKKMWVYYIEPLLEEYLANRLEDDSVREKLKEICKSFCEDLKS